MTEALIMSALLIAQVAVAPDLIDRMAQFGAAGVLLIALGGFAWFLERMLKRHDTVVAGWTVAIEGLRKDMQDLTAAVKQLDSDVRHSRRRN